MLGNGELLLSSFFRMMDLELEFAISHKIWHLNTRRQHQCVQTVLLEEPRDKKNSFKMASSSSTTSYSKCSPIVSAFLFFFFFFISSVCPVQSDGFNRTKQGFRLVDETKKLKFVKDQLMKINKPPVKTFQVTKFFNFGQFRL